MSDLVPDARRSMLRRLASDLNVLAHAPEMRWTCCHQGFDHVTYYGTVEKWTWRFCNGGMPGDLYNWRPCGHWHHQHECPPMASGGSRP